MSSEEDYPMPAPPTCRHGLWPHEHCSACAASPRSKSEIQRDNRDEAIRLRQKDGDARSERKCEHPKGCHDKDGYHICGMTARHPRCVDKPRVSCPDQRARSGPVISDDDKRQALRQIFMAADRYEQVEIIGRLLATFAERVAAKFMEADRGDAAPVLWTPQQAARIVREAAVAPPSGQDPTRHADRVKNGAGWKDPSDGYGGAR